MPEFKPGDRVQRLCPSMVAEMSEGSTWVITRLTQNGARTLIDKGYTTEYPKSWATNNE